MKIANSEILPKNRCDRSPRPGGDPRAPAPPASPRRPGRGGRAPASQRPLGSPDGPARTARSSPGPALLRGRATRPMRPLRRADPTLLCLASRAHPRRALSSPLEPRRRTAPAYADAPPETSRSRCERPPRRPAGRVCPAPLAEALRGRAVRAPQRPRSGPPASPASSCREAQREHRRRAPPWEAVSPEWRGRPGRGGGPGTARHWARTRRGRSGTCPTGKEGTRAAGGCSPRVHSAGTASHSASVPAGKTLQKQRRRTGEKTGQRSKQQGSGKGNRCPPDATAGARRAEGSRDSTIGF